MPYIFKTKFVQSTNIDEDLQNLRNEIENNTNKNQENKNTETVINNDKSDNNENDYSKEKLMKIYKIFS